MPELPDAAGYKDYLNAAALHRQVLRTKVLDMHLLKEQFPQQLGRRLKGAVGGDRSPRQIPLSPNKRQRLVVMQFTMSRNGGRSATTTHRSKGRRDVDRKESPLSHRQLAGFRRILIERRRELVSGMEQSESILDEEANRDASRGAISAVPTHPADVSSDDHERDVALTRLEQQRKVLIEIDEALRRIDEGVYGRCMATGKPIREDRLLATPWARYCAEYAREIEEKEKPPLTFP